MQRLNAARPTAVNLAWALERMPAKLRPLPVAQRAAAAWEEAEAIAEEDVAVNAAIGRHGLPLLQEIAAGEAEGIDGYVVACFGDPGLLAARIEPAVQAHLVAGQRSRERAHAAVLRALGLEPLLTLRLRAGEGVGACLAASMILQGLRMRRLAARTVE